MTIRNLTKEDVIITVSAEQEDSVEDCGYGLKAINAFSDMVDKYGVWGWCCVNVTVTWNGFRGTEYLGHCSYKSKEDFIETSGYYYALLEDALSELNKDIKHAYDTIKELEE